MSKGTTYSSTLAAGPLLTAPRTLSISPTSSAFPHSPSDLTPSFTAIPHSSLDPSLPGQNGTYETFYEYDPYRVVPNLPWISADGFSLDLYDCSNGLISIEEFGRRYPLNPNIPPFNLAFNPPSKRSYTNRPVSVQESVQRHPVKREPLPLNPTCNPRSKRSYTEAELEEPEDRYRSLAQAPTERFAATTRHISKKRRGERPILSIEIPPVRTDLGTAYRRISKKQRGKRPVLTIEIPPVRRDLGIAFRKSPTKSPIQSSDPAPISKAPKKQKQNPTSTTNRKGWTDEEHDAITKAIIEFQQEEHRVHGGVVLKDTKLFGEVASRLMALENPVNRPALGCKAYWGRYGRVKALWNEQTGMHDPYVKATLTQKPKSKKASSEGSKAKK